MYRMTMEGVYGLADKDTGDVRGDMSFVLYKKESARKTVSVVGNYSIGSRNA